MSKVAITGRTYPVLLHCLRIDAWILYRDPIRLRIPVAAIDLAPSRHAPITKLTLTAVTELVTLVTHYEALCPSPRRRLAPAAASHPSGHPRRLQQDPSGDDP